MRGLLVRRSCPSAQEADRLCRKCRYADLSLHRAAGERIEAASLLLVTSREPSGRLHGELQARRRIPGPPAAKPDADRRLRRAGAQLQQQSSPDTNSQGTSMSQNPMASPSYANPISQLPELGSDRDTA